MSVKIKINWDNQNVVSESVRIYRADSAFTKENLPPILTEFFWDVYEYEDQGVIEGQTYFYMLSAKLGEQEAFTECFEIVAVPDLSKTLAITPAFFSPSSLNMGWNSETGDFKAWKSGFTHMIDYAGNSMKIYASPYRKSSAGSFYYEVICTKVINLTGSELTVYPSDNMFGLMQNGATVNLQSTSAGSSNGYGRYILKNGTTAIEGAGANLTTSSPFTTKIAAKQLQLNQVWGIGIRASGSNTLVEFWIDGVYQGVMFTISGTSVELRPLIIFTLENNYIKATHYRYPRKLSHLPDGFQSWLAV